jgi:hypothetical protein
LGRGILGLGLGMGVLGKAGAGIAGSLSR